MWLVETIRPANQKTKGVKTQTLLEKSGRRDRDNTGHTPRLLLPGKRDAQTRADLTEGTFPVCWGWVVVRNHYPGLASLPLHAVSLVKGFRSLLPFQNLSLCSISYEVRIPFPGKGAWS